MTAERITVLGGAGFVGSHLVRHLRAAGQDAFVPERGDPRVFGEPLGDVVYAIGLTADFRQRPLDTVEAHVCLLRRLLAEADFRSLTYLSSTRVYAGAASTREDASLVVNPCEPGDLYNLSKLMGESLCLHGRRAGVKVARLSNIVGLRPDADLFVDQLLEEGRTRGHIVLHTAPASRKDYLWIDDAVRALSQIARSPAGGIFNVASGEGVSGAEVLLQIESCLDYPWSVVPNAPVWDFMPICTERLRVEFGFAPRRFDDYFPEYLAQYRARYHDKRHEGRKETP